MKFHAHQIMISQYFVIEIVILRRENTYFSLAFFTYIIYVNTNEG